MTFDEWWKQMKPAECDELKSTFIECWEVAQEEDMGEPCEWTADEDGVWDTACGGRFEVMEGTPSENQMYWCPYCGKSLQEAELGERED